MVHVPQNTLSNSCKLQIVFCTNLNTCNNSLWPTRVSVSTCTSIFLQNSSRYICMPLLFYYVSMQIATIEHPMDKRIYLYTNQTNTFSVTMPNLSIYLIITGSVHPESDTMAAGAAIPEWGGNSHSGALIHHRRPYQPLQLWGP